MNIRLVTVTSLLVVLAQGRSQHGPQAPFHRAALAGDQQTVIDLIQNDQQMAYAIDYGMNLLTMLTSNPKEAETRKLFDFLNAALKKGRQVTVLDHYEPLFRKGGRSFVDALRAMRKEYRSLVNPGVNINTSMWESICKDLKVLAGKNEEIKDMMAAANCYRAILAFTGPRSKSDRDRWEADAVRNFLRLRELWDYTQDQAYKKAKQYAKENRIAECGKLVFKPGSTWTKPPQEVRTLQEPLTGVSPFAGRLPVLWCIYQILGIIGQSGSGGDGTVRMGRYGQLIRNGANTYGIDIDRDGKPEQKFSLSNVPTRIVFSCPVSGRPVEQALFMWIPGQYSTLGDYSVAVYATEGRNARSSIHIRGGTTVAIKVGNKEITCIDENGTGSLESFYTYEGHRRHSLQKVWAGDSMILPYGRGPVPFSEIITIDGEHYKLEFNGLECRYRQIQLTKEQIGRIRLEYKGPGAVRPQHFIVAESTAYRGAVYDLMSHNGGLEVPAGQYELVGGLITSDRKNSLESGLLMKGKMKPITVEPGKETRVKIGAP